MSTQRWTAIKNVLRDLVLFGVGVAIILKQAGILLEPPNGGPQLELMFLGALFCNGPLVLQYLALRRGLSLPPPPELPSGPASPSAPPSASSGAGDQ